MHEVDFDVSSIDCNPFSVEFGDEKIKEYQSKNPSVDGGEKKQEKVSNVEKTEIPAPAPVESKPAQNTDSKEEVKENNEDTTPPQNVPEEKKESQEDKNTNSEIKADEPPATPTVDLSEDIVKKPAPKEAESDAKTTPIETPEKIKETKTETPKPIPKKEQTQTPVVEENIVKNKDQNEFNRKQIISMNDIILGLVEKEDDLEKQLPSLKKLYITGIIEREEYDFLVQSVVAKIKELDKKIDYEIEMKKIKECKKNIEDDITQALLKGELKGKTQKAMETLERLYNDGIINQKTYVDGKNQIMIREQKVKQLIKRIEEILDGYVNERREQTKERVETNFDEVEEKINKRKNSLWTTLKKSLKK
ncbi:MAG: hypothetical protein KAR87_04655 [Candidatus Aenigmarchaeota archaeon]|nr:hypothetical protein [Candidatus Aenigmarchaeota archaeon]